MRATRRTQPYRKTAPRHPGLALTSMLRGRTTGGMNPADVSRGAATLMRAAKAGKRHRRPARPARPKRPAR